MYDVRFLLEKRSAHYFQGGEGEEIRIKYNYNIEKNLWFIAFFIITIIRKFFF